MNRARIVAAALALAVVGSLVVAAASPASTDQRPAVTTHDRPSAMIENRLEERFGQDRTQDFWILLAADAATAKARGASTWAARGRQVVGALRQTADRSQADARSILDAAGVDYDAYWIVNAIRVEDATLTLARRLTELDSVAQIRTPVRYHAPKPVTARPSTVASNGIEWGVSNIRADQVWSQYDVRGDGIVVGSIDTGVQYDHPALVDHYRGNNGDGTFDHDYNWFDAADACGGAPCDSNSSSHGTHTMGTMIGDDGNGNQIGVAPEAQWITANGCCPSDAALLASAQWMLAPTDHAGANPDVTKRPDIVNNSWGTKLPSNDPFMEDILTAWADAGIFGVWANGNTGSDCRTSGAPGSRIINHSVGAYDSTNTIADFSSRGEGQDGEIKPNISAPGASIRSSQDGSSYGVISGTSMAAPHVTGAIALLWSARPELVGHIQVTRELLDVSAIDTPDDQCGGSAGDNNVYGEGRLDALALVEYGSQGIGTLTGTVTYADTGDPAADIPVAVTGGIDRSVRTRPDGSYSMALLPGDYDLTIDGPFGYDDAAESVQVTRDQTTSHNVELAPTSRVPLRGLVRDGSGQGWPLYAKVTAEHESGYRRETYTDPTTGAYQLDVVHGVDYTLRVAAVYPGYEPMTQTVTVGAGGTDRDVDLTVAFQCTAAGYQVIRDGQTQSFDRGRPPRWRVVNTDRRYPGYDHRPGWVFDDPGGRGNRTEGAGGFAIVDSDHAGQHHYQDTSLVSPTVDLRGVPSPAVEFEANLRPAVNSTATVEVSTDEGRTWTRVWTRRGYPGLDGNHAIRLTEATNAANVKIRFGYTGQWSGWWAIDDVFLGDRSCEPVDGGLVVGQVADATSGAGLVGATIADAADPGHTTRSVATPGDSGLGDGIYGLFSPNAGERAFTASSGGYADQTRSATITAGEATALDFTLDPTGGTP